MKIRAQIALLFLTCLLITPTGLLAQDNPFGEDQVIENTGDADNPFAVQKTVEEFSIDRSWVNVRKGPGTNNSKVGCLPRGSKGRKIAEKDGWYKIEFENGLTGWVYAKLLKKEENVPQEPEDDSSRIIAENEKQFERWERHLGEDLLDYDRFPWYWKLKRASNEYNEGKYEEALKLAKSSSGNPYESAFLQAKCYAKLGEHEKAAKILSILEKYLEDMVMVKKLDKMSAPYIDEPIVFKFGGFDDIKTYKAKKANGNRVGLNSGEYYDKFVNIKTWKWRSKSAYQEFQKIGGIDCSGFVQMMQKEAFKEAGVKYPITSGRTSTRGLWSEKYTVAINPGHTPPPPPDIRPGDMILLDYGHNRYGHSMIYRGTDSNGNIRVIQMGDTAQEAILSPEKYKYFKGAYRMKGMDQVREALTA